MPTSKSRNTRDLPTIGEVTLDDRSWQVFLVAALLNLRGRTPTVGDIARRAGLSVDHASDVLHWLPPKLLVNDREGGGSRWMLPMDLRAALESNGPFLGEQLSTVVRRLALRSRPVASTKRAEVLRDLEEAEHALYSGDIAGARDLVSGRHLSLRDVLALTPPRERALMRGRVAVLDVDALMNGDEPERALQFAGRVLRDSAGLSPAHLIRIYASAAAAARMISFEHLPEAARLFDAALHFVSAAPLESSEKRYYMRWLLASKATPLTLLGRLSDADACLRRAFDNLDPEDYSGHAEAALLSTRVAILTNRIGQAETLIERAELAARKGSLWIQGWVPRYVSDLSAGLPQDRTPHPGPKGSAFVDPIAQAWRLCKGFGFQERLLLARIATHAIDPTIDRSLRESHPDVTSQMSAGISRLHVQRFRTRPTDCPECRTAALAYRARHALGLENQASWRFYY